MEGYRDVSFFLASIEENHILHGEFLQLFLPKSMFNYILFGIYLLAIILLAGFLIVFRMHLEGYFQYSKYLK